MMYLKLDGEHIVGHDYHAHDDYQTEIEDTILVYLEGPNMKRYKYKYVGGKLIELTQAEIDSHPLHKKNDLKKKINQLHAKQMKKTAYENLKNDDKLTKEEKDYIQELINAI